MSGPKAARKPMKLGVQISLGFGVFILIITVLLWTFQIALLGPFYRSIKTAEVKKTADTVLRNLEKDTMEMDALVRDLSLDTGVNIVVSDELGALHGNFFYSHKESPLYTVLNHSGNYRRAFLSELFSRVNLTGGELLEPYGRETIFYSRVARTKSGEPR